MNPRQSSAPKSSNPPDMQQYAATHAASGQAHYENPSAAAGQYQDANRQRHHYNQHQQQQGGYANNQPNAGHHHHQQANSVGNGPSTASYQSSSTHGKLSGGTSQIGGPTSVLGDRSTSASYPHFSGGPSSTGGYSHGPTGYEGQQQQSGGQMYNNPIGRTPTDSSHLSASGVETHHVTSSYFGGSRIVTGEEVVIGINTIQGEERVISERIVEHEIKVPKKIVVEEVIEKVIVIPETITREEYVDEIQKITETIIEVAKPIIQEKIIEVHEIEYRDMIIERVEKVQKEKIREIPKIEYQERIVEVPKYITREKIVEVPEIEYRDVFVEKIIEVPEYREQIVIKEVAVPQYVDKPVAEYVDVETPFEVGRNIPVPVEAVTTFEYQLVQFRPRVHTVQYPLYVPRFVEVPVAAELFDSISIAQLTAENAKLQCLRSTQAVSLCEVEKMATEFRRNDIAAAASNIDLQQALVSAWQSNSIQVKHGAMHMRTAVTGTQSSVITASWAESYGQQHIGQQQVLQQQIGQQQVGQQQVVQQPATMPYANATSVSRPTSVAGASNAPSKNQKSVSSRHHH